MEEWRERETGFGGRRDGCPQRAARGRAMQGAQAPGAAAIPETASELAAIPQPRGTLANGWAGLVLHG
jgi:hypothetical protein